MNNQSAGAGHGAYHCSDLLSATGIVLSNVTYADAPSEVSMLSASVFMFALAGFFFNLNVLGGVFNVGAILAPRVRVLFTSSLSLFLPVMSYLLSEAKNTSKERSSSRSLVDRITHGVNMPSDSDLPFTAGVILTWMLLVELIRKKVDEIAMRGYSGTIHRAGRVAWLGNLVFLNIRSAGRRAIFGVLWVLCATKLVQRIAFTEVGKRSYTCGKNARIINSHIHMSSMTTNTEDGGAEDAMLKRCRYIVTGEEDLDVEATADGYKLNNTRKSLVTVGNIWDGTSTTVFTEADHLRRLCLSFALFKLLRRRLEHVVSEMSIAETSECRGIIFGGLYKSKDTAAAEAVFEVMKNEINFLSEYYHSVVPVVLASPFFFVVNYFLLPIVVSVICLMTIILCGGGDVQFVFHSIKTDNFTLSSGIFQTTICFLSAARKSPAVFFTAINFAITSFLYLIYAYEEVWEFFVFLLSNWFAVSLICSYVGKPHWSHNSVLRAFVRCILSIRRLMGFLPKQSFKQFSALNLRWPPLTLSMPTALMSLLVSTKPVPNQVKHSILNSLAVQCGYDDDATATATASPRRLLISNGGRSALEAAKRTDLDWACKSDSVAEVILTWHIATGLLEQISCPPPEMMRKKKAIRDNFTVATTLSRYCAYLVAFQPELLPDYHEKAEDVFEAMKAELKDRLGCGRYYLCRARAAAIMNPPLDKLKEKLGVVHKGVRLAELLKNPTATASASVTVTNATATAGPAPAPATATATAATAAATATVTATGTGTATATATATEGDADFDTMWRLLAEVWTELLIYVAPSNDEERIMAHKKLLWQGGEFITLLWALTTHTGITITRPPRKSTSGDNNNRQAGTGHEITVNVPEH